MLKFSKNLKNLLSINNSNFNRQNIGLFVLNKSFFSSYIKQNSENLSEEIKKARYEQIQLSKLSKRPETGEFNLQNNNNNNDDDSDFLILSNEEKILSKVLLRNILYSDKNPLANNDNNNDNNNNTNNNFYNKISNILLTNFNYSENELNNINNNIENSLIYQTPKKFYIDWTSSKLTEGKFNLRISTQSKNIIFEDLFLKVKNKKQENEVLLFNQKVKSNSKKINNKESSSESESDLLSNSSSQEDKEITEEFQEKLNELDFPSDFFNFSDTNKTSKFNFEINFDRKKPNQVLFFCEKLFINDIISADDLAYIKTLAPITGRNFKFTQNQNLLNNQYEDFEEAINEIRIYEKIEGLNNSTALMKLRIDLNLLYSREDHRINKKISLDFSKEKKFAYVITNFSDVEKLSKINFVEKCDSGDYLNNFIEKVTSENYQRNYKIFMLNKDSEILVNNYSYKNLLEKIGEKNTLSFFNTVEEMEKEIFEFSNPRFDIKLNKDNYIEVPVGYLNFSNEILFENYMKIKKEILNELKNLKKSLINLRPKNNFVKKISIFVEENEFRIKEKI
jgi:ribosomal protein L1